MYYIPEDYLNSNYRYTISNDIITVHTNHNCYQNYNTTYCDCYNIYPNHNYLITDVYSCNYNSSTTIPYSHFTSNEYYRNDIAEILIIFFILFFFIVIIPFKLFSRFFGRWFKL